MLGADNIKISSQEYLEIFHGAKKKTKYGAVRTVVDGINFASKKEAKHYQLLKKQVELGHISDLQLQPSWEFPIKTEKGRGYRYIADFSYYDKATCSSVILDVKGKKTDTYKLKKGMMKYFYNIDVKEV